MVILTRRKALAGLSVMALSGLGAPSILRAREVLTIYGPPAAPSAVLAHAIKSGLLADVMPDAVFRAWKSPDEMRAAVASGNMGAVVMPSYGAANLRNRGLDIGLLNILSNGLLYIVSKDETLTTLESLRGKSLSLPFRNDMPDLVVGRLVAEAGMEPSAIRLEYAATPPEAVQLLLTGRVDAALLSEPAATGVILKAKSLFMDVHRVIDVQQEWAKFSGKPAIPQAGLALTREMCERIGPSGVEGLQSALEKALEQAIADPLTAAASASEVLGFPPEIIAASFPTSHLVASRARAARPDLEHFYEILAQTNPAIIGGRLPDDGFYLL